MRFEYKSTSLKNMQVEVEPYTTSVNVQTGTQSGHMIHGGRISAIIVDGERIAPTGRFWESLYSRFNLNKAFFRYFGHDEVFKRISERGDDSVRLCIERTDSGPRLLAATGLNKPVLIYDDLMEILSRFNVDVTKIGYHDGIVRSTHTPRIGDYKFTIGGDDFRNRFELHAPIDGYGQPNLYLQLLRLICSNGMTGYANAFKTALQLGHGGDNTRYALMRALDGFTSDEGYAQMRERFDSATRSWASLREQQSLYQLLIRLPETTAESGFLQSFEQLTGRPVELYSRDPNLLTERKQRSLPVTCRIYEMMNFATELSTHKVSEASARKLDTWIGSMLSGEFDLEDTCDSFDDWRAFFVRDNAGKHTAAANARQATLDESKQ